MDLPPGRVRQPQGISGETPWNDGSSTSRRSRSIAVWWGSSTTALLGTLWSPACSPFGFQTRFWAKPFFFFFTETGLVKLVINYPIGSVRVLTIAANYLMLVFSVPNPGYKISNLALDSIKDTEFVFSRKRFHPSISFCDFWQHRNFVLKR